MLSFVLARRDFRENDQIITFYTLERGKLEVLARGVKKASSRNSAHLEPMSLVEADIIPGKEWHRLGSVKPVVCYSNMRENLAKSMAVGYVTALLVKLLQAEEAERRIFELLRGWAELLEARHDFDWFLVDIFVVKLFAILGFDMSFSDQIDEQSGEFLAQLDTSDWSLADRARFTTAQRVSLHNLIYKLAIFHGERGLSDWQKVGHLASE